jgi:hypothetical protein
MRGTVSPTQWHKISDLINMLIETGLQYKRYTAPMKIILTFLECPSLIENVQIKYTGRNHTLGGGIYAALIYVDRRFLLK